MCLRHPPSRRCRHRPLIGAESNHQLNWWFMTYDLSGAVRKMIVTASALHDIGKIGIDDKILNKPGRLTKEEFEVIKTHSAIGASMFESLEYYRNEPLVRIAHDICRWHHERYDGKGYPDGLKGEEIPISAQVVALADVYDALISDCVYKKAYSHEKAVEMILNGECGTFNPLLLECLKDIQGRLKEEMTTERMETKDRRRKSSCSNPCPKISEKNT